MHKNFKNFGFIILGLFITLSLLKAQPLSHFKHDPSFMGYRQLLPNMNSSKASLLKNAQGHSEVTLVGRWSAGPCYAVTVAGDYAYISKDSSLGIINISNPSKPIEIGEIVLPYEPRNAFVRGNYVYVADWWEGLRIIDVSDASMPKEMGFFDTGAWAFGIYVSGAYAYVADYDDGLRIIDVSDPRGPHEVGYYDTGSYAVNVYISGSYAYVADWWDGLRVINVSDPKEPHEVGYYDTGSYALNVYVSGSYAYVADGWDGLRIINVSDPREPHEVGYYDTGNYAMNVYVSGAYAYVADGKDGLRIFDVHDPREPFEVGYYDTGGTAKGVFVYKSYIYVADGGDGLYILKFTGATGIEKNAIDIPKTFTLQQNYPNPFNSATAIEFYLPQRSYTQLTVYNLLGQRIRTLAEATFVAGNHRVIWDGRNNQGSMVPSGIYFCRMKAGTFTGFKKMMFIR